MRRFILTWKTSLIISSLTARKCPSEEVMRSVGIFQILARLVEMMSLSTRLTLFLATFMMTPALTVLFLTLTTGAHYFLERRWKSLMIMFCGQGYCSRWYSRLQSEFHRQILLQSKASMMNICALSQAPQSWRSTSWSDGDQVTSQTWPGMIKIHRQVTIWWLRYEQSTTGV